MTITAIIKRKFDTKTVGTNGFETREVHVTTEEQYPQILSMQFTQGRVSLLDGFEAGDKVKIDLNLKGREWTNTQGELVVFNTIEGWRIVEVK
jgi:translation initiation factor IF-3